jgi:hypothetical protein
MLANLNCKGAIRKHPLLEFAKLGYEALALTFINVTLADPFFF